MFAWNGVRRREQQVGEQVDVTDDGRHTDREARGQTRGVEQRALAVGEHGPEPFERLCRDTGPELRDVALEAGADEIVAQRQALGVRAGEVAVGEAAAQP